MSSTRVCPTRWMSSPLRRARCARIYRASARSRPLDARAKCQRTDECADWRCLRPARYSICMPSFDIVSELNAHEVANAVDQATREVDNRFDFKGTGAKFAL